MSGIDENERWARVAIFFDDDDDLLFYRVESYDEKRRLELLRHGIRPVDVALLARRLHGYIGVALPEV